NKDDPTLFTRPWFAWANSMFGEMLYGLYERGMLAEVLTLVKTAGITKI
ncbi:MAG: glycoside hydrolase family 125 protein, partial [Clostridia bacterium]